MAKVDLYPDFRELFKSLNSHRVKYLLLGGYAVIYYGYARTTSDLDIWIALEQKNAEKLSRVLQHWGGFLTRDVPSSMFMDAGRVFQFGLPPVRVDFLTGPSGVEFQECYKRRKVVTWDGVRVPLIGIEDLKANKLASGREKDFADLAFLSRAKTI